MRYATFDCADAGRTARWWAEALSGTVTVPYPGAAILETGGPGLGLLLFLDVPEAKTAKNRVHLDLLSAKRAADVARLVPVGTASRSTGPGLLIELALVFVRAAAGLRLVTQQWAGSTTRSFPGPALGEVIGGADAALGYSAACPADWLHLDVTAAVRNWTSGAWANHGVAVTASETDSYGWKKFNANQGLRSPHIALGYSDNRAPDVPRMLAPVDHATLPATPSLQAVYADPDGNTGGIDFRVSDAAGRDVTGNPAGYAWSSSGPSGRTVSYTPPELADGRYTWATRAWDGQAHPSPQWAYTGTFTIDRSAPAGDLGVGRRRFHTLDEQALTDRSSVGVNVANGNLIVSETDLSVAGTGQDLAVTRTYNSQSTQTSELGARPR